MLFALFEGIPRSRGREDGGESGRDALWVGGEVDGGGVNGFSYLNHSRWGKYAKENMHSVPVPSARRSPPKMTSPLRISANNPCNREYVYQ